MVFVESAYTIPLAFMFFYTTLVSLNPTLEEASAVAGASGIQTFVHVTLPNMWPSIVSVATILFVVGFESFDVAWFIGYPARIYILAIELYTMTKMSFPSDFAGASVYGMIAVALAFGLIAIYRRVTRDQSRFTAITGKAYRRGVIDIGRARYVACALFYGFVLSIGVVPLIVLLAMSLQLFTIPFTLHAQGTFENFHWIFSDPQSLRSILNTAVISIVGAVAAVIAGFMISYSVTRTHEPGRSVLEYLAFLPFATPSTVLALGIIAILVWTPLYNTVWIMIVAFAIKFLPYALRSISNNLIQIHPELEEASFVSGGSLFTTLRRVTFPIAVPGLIAAWSMLLIIYSRQFSLPMMLASPDSQVITISMFNEWESGQMGHVAAYGVLLSLCCLPLLILARLLDGKAASA
jgi:iron(III) transport system permease protein